MRDVFLCRRGIAVGVGIFFWLAYASSAAAQGDAPQAGDASATLDALGLPAGEYDANIESPHAFFGFEVGSRHLRHHQLVDYFEYLPTVSELVTTKRYAKSHGDRPLLSTVITSKKNHARLDELLAAHRQLCDPATAGEVKIEDQPLVMYMGYGVHGDESSGSNAAPLVAHYLCAGPGRKYLDDMVIVLDPSLNPDGFDRFAAWANAYRGKSLNIDSAHREHVQGWPGGRVNYYWFDLNRDWMPLQHPESKGRAELFFEFRPNVVLDFHEMSTNATYFFQPGVPARKHPDTPVKNQTLTRQLAEFHATALDQIGSLYFTEERFDDFYMGKGSTYPDLHGAVGILFEQGSSRGHAQESTHGTVTFPFTIRNQVTTSLSSLRGASQHREALLAYQREFYQAAMIEAESQATRAYAFTCPGNPDRLAPFEQMLRSHRIEVLRDGDRLVVPTDQAEYRFLKSLFDERTSFEENIFYDVSTWNMAYAFGLEMERLERVPKINASSERQSAPEAATTQRDALASGVGVLIDYRRDAAVPLLNRLLTAGVIVKVAQEEFGFDDRTYPIGSLMIPLGIQRESVPAVAAALADAEGVYEVVETGLTPQGIDLGSSSFARVETQRVLMLIGQGVDRYQAGALWHYLDTRLQLPVTLVDIHDLPSVDLTKYSCIIMPRGSYSAADHSAPRLKTWVQSGGTLLAFNSAIPWTVRHQFVPASFVTDSHGEVGAGEVGHSEAGHSAGHEVAEHAAQDQVADDAGRRAFVDARKDHALTLISGAIFETDLDRTHPLGYGFPSRRLAVFRNSALRLNRSPNVYSNPAVYTKSPLLAGYASDTNVEMLQGSASVTLSDFGNGRVVMMVDDPTFRAFWHGTQRFVANTIYFGSLLTDPKPAEEHHHE